MTGRRVGGTRSSKEADDFETGLSRILEHLPIAVGLFDAQGQVVSRSGALRTVLGAAIPSRDPAVAQLWTVYDAAGRVQNPPDWPGARALRGETIMSGMPAEYRAGRGEHRWLRVAAMPFREPRGFLGGITLVQDLDQDRRARDNLRDELESRFVETLFDALRKVLNANDLEPRLARRFVERTIGLATADEAKQPDELTAREADVLKLIAWGKTQKDAGTRLGISAKTVEFHRDRAMSKLGLQGRTELIRFALGQGWMTPFSDPDRRWLSGEQ